MSQRLLSPSRFQWKGIETDVNGIITAMRYLCAWAAPTLLPGPRSDLQAASPLLWGQRGTQGSLTSSPQEGCLQLWGPTAPPIVWMSVSPGCWLYLKKPQVHSGSHRIRLSLVSHSHAGPGTKNSVDPCQPPASHSATAPLPSNELQMSPNKYSPSQSLHPAWVATYLHTTLSPSANPIFLPQRPQDLTILTAPWPPTSCSLPPPCMPGSLTGLKHKYYPFF